MVSLTPSPYGYPSSVPGGSIPERTTLKKDMTDPMLRHISTIYNDYQFPEFRERPLSLWGCLERTSLLCECVWPSCCTPGVGVMWRPLFAHIGCLILSSGCTLLSYNYYMFIGTSTPRDVNHDVTTVVGKYKTTDARVMATYAKLSRYSCSSAL